MKESFQILAEFETALKDVARLRSDFLYAMGWKEVCDIGGVWLWAKEIDGKHVRVDMAAALRHAEQECNPTDNEGN